MSYRVLRQYTLRFGYVRIKQEKRERYQYKRRNKKVPLHSAKQLFYVCNGTNYINYANFIMKECKLNPHIFYLIFYAFLLQQLHLR